MLKKRIIPCLDIKDGRTVKGISFVNLRDAGDPVELARAYAEQSADELVFLDISATDERRKTLAPLVEKIAAAINIPFTVGGGITTREDVSVLISSELTRSPSIQPQYLTRRSLPNWQMSTAASAWWWQ